MNADLSESKKTREEIEIQRLMLYTVVNNLPAGVGIIRGSDLRYVLVNSEYQSIAPGKEIIGKTLDEVWPELKPKIQEICKQVLETGNRLHASDELFMIRRSRDGPLEPAYFSWSLCRVRLPGDEGWGMLNTLYETTERKKTEQALRENEQLLKKSQEIARFGSWKLDLKDNHLSWSDEVYRIFGLGPQEFDATYEAFLNAVHPEDRKLVDDAYSGSLREGKDTYEVEHRIVRKHSGEVRVVQEKCYHVRDESGQITESVGVVLDITERKKAEEALFESEKRYRSLVDSSPDAVIVHADGKLLYANSAALDLYGADSFEQLAAFNILKLIPAEDSAEAMERVHKIMGGQRMPLREARIVRIDGKIVPVEVVSAPYEHKEKRSIQAIVRNISQRKAAQANLFRLASFPKLNPNPVVEVGFDGIVRYMNPAASSMLPKLKESGENHPFFRGWEKILSAFRDEKMERVSREIEFGKSYYYQSFSLVPGTDRIHVYAMNIDALKQAEKALRETSDYLNNLLDYANAPIIVWSPDFKITKFNRAFERLTGMTANEAVGKHLDILFPAETKNEAMAHIQKALAGEYWESVEISVLHKDGTERMVLWNSANICGPDKNIVATIAQGQDITERKLAERKLRETSDYLNSLLDYANAPIIVWDTKLRITRFNRAFERLTGLSAGDAIGKPLSILFPKERTKEAMGHIGRTLAGEYWEAVEIPVLNREGNVRTVLWNSANIYDSSQKNVIATIAQGQDVTERNRAEERLREVERFATIGRTAAMVGHDLRNPLQGIVGNVALTELDLKNIRMSVQNKKRLKKSLTAIKSQVQYMDKIVSDLNAYAAPIIPKFSEVSVSKQVKEALLSIHIPENVNITVKIPESLPKITVDPFLLKRVLVNLIANGVQAMSGGGKLVISAASDDEKGLVSLSFEDTGVGIREGDKPNIFKPLFTTKAKGQGLGLPVCKRLMEAQRGTIRFESKLGKGTKFTIAVPQAKNSKNPLP